MNTLVDKNVISFTKFDQRTHRISKNKFPVFLSLSHLRNPPPYAINLE